MVETNREYKDGLFRDIFNEPRRLCSLSNGLLKIDATVQQIAVNTLENELFSRQRNDVSCMVNQQLLVVGEHMSSLRRDPYREPNLGIMFRLLRYTVKLLEKELDHKHTVLPIPRLFVLYNGRNKLNDADDDCVVIRMPYLQSDFDEQAADIVVTATVYNINRGRSSELLARCQPLKEYAEFIGAVRDNEAAGLALNAAIAKAVNDCKNGELADYFRGRKIERVIAMLTLDVSYEEELEQVKAQAAAEARAETEARIRAEARAQAAAERAEMLQMLAQKDQEAAKAQREKAELQQQLDELKRQAQLKTRNDNNSRGGTSR